MTALRIASAIGLVVVGVIHLLPVPGVLGGAWLRSLYGVEALSADLEILLRHRAVLFGILGVLLLASVLSPALRPAAALAAAVSMASFIAVALLVGNYGPAVSRVVIADAIGLLALAPVLLDGRSRPGSVRA